MPRLHEIRISDLREHPAPGERALTFQCPGCGCAHFFTVGGPHGWQWNGSVDLPTVTPSIKVTGVGVCHSYVTNGKIIFLADCTHPLAGKTVDLPDWED
jgi:hypothetical protein